MSYIKAENVLPQELIETIQQYVDGKLIYAKEMLRQNLINARKIGIKDFLITCHPWNEASEKTILANGGVFEKLVDAGDGEMLKRYWIDALK